MWRFLVSGSRVGTARFTPAHTTCVGPECKQVIMAGGLVQLNRVGRSALVAL